MITKIIKGTEYEILSQEQFDFTGNRYLLTRKVFDSVTIYVTWLCTPKLACFYPHKFLNERDARKDYHQRLARAYET